MIVANPILGSSVVSRMHQAALLTQKGDAEHNTRKAYNPKQIEYEQYIEQVFPGDLLAHVLSAEKVYTFMFYQAARELKRQGGGKKRKDNEQDTPILFDIEGFNRIMEPLRSQEGWSQKTPLPVPQRGVGISLFVQYKSALHEIYEEQVVRKVQPNPWDHIWTLDCDRLWKIVKQRVPKQKKRNFDEKAAGEINPYEIALEYPEVEKKLWERGQSKGTFQAAVDLRSRYTLTHTTAGILRYESLQKAELSDFLAIQMQREKDPHVTEVMVTELPEGKTNDGNMLYGRAARHKDVRLCAVNGFAFYMGLRLEVSKEFEDFPKEKWLSNKEWFNIKLLTDVRLGADHTHPLSDNQYSNTIADVLGSMGLSHNKKKHFGRKMGPKLMELLEAEQGDIQVLGNWDPNTQQKAYSSKLPMRAIRMAAGFDAAGGMYYNPRTSVEISNRDLLLATPFGPLEDAFIFVEAEMHDMSLPDSKKPLTAYRFLKFMRFINKVFLQDAAAMMILHPERANHPIFHLECFKMAAFHVSKFVFDCCILGSFGTSRLRCTVRNLGI